MSIRKVLDDAIAAALTVSALTNTATGGVWNASAEQLAPPVPATFRPYVVFNQQSEVITQTFDKRLYDELYVVKAVVKGWPMAGSALDAICDGLLNNQPLTIVGATHIKTLREGAIGYSEVIGGVLFSHVGGFYRIQADKAG